jgi:hypothetical protein
MRDRSLHVVSKRRYTSQPGVVRDANATAHRSQRFESLELFEDVVSLHDERAADFGETRKRGERVVAQP